MPFWTTFDIRAEYSVLMSLSSKWTSEREAQHVLVEFDPLLHLPFFDVADDVVDRLAGRPGGTCGAVAFGVERLEARSEDAAVAVAVDEAVRRVAVGADGGES